MVMKAVKNIKLVKKTLFVFKSVRYNSRSKSDPTTSLTDTITTTDSSVCPTTG
jgi:hypothetical protein